MTCKCCSDGNHKKRKKSLGHPLLTFTKKEFDGAVKQHIPTKEEWKAGNKKIADFFRKLGS